MLQVSINFTLGRLWVISSSDLAFSLPIMFPSIPESSTKSRVEIQVRVTVDLADPSSSIDPHIYDRVGSWKWLKLPPGTATKRRTRKQGKIGEQPTFLTWYLLLTINQTLTLGISNFSHRQRLLRKSSA